MPLHAHDSLVDIRALPVSGCSEWADAVNAQSCLCQFLSNYTLEEGPAPAVVFTWLTSSGAAQAIFGLATANVSQHMQVLPQALKGALDGARSSALHVSDFCAYPRHNAWATHFACKQLTTSQCLSNWMNWSVDQEGPSFCSMFPQPVLDSVVALLCPPLPASSDVLEPLVSAACGAFRVAEERGSRLVAPPACLESVVMLCRSSSATPGNRCGCAGILAVASSDVKDAHTLQAVGISLLSCLIPAEDGAGLSAAGLDAIMDVFSDDDHYRNEVLMALNVLPRILAFLPIFQGFITSIEAKGVLLCMCSK